ncbi:MAG: hypothetical protein J6S14_15735 [Clostridia bacterium]|nr:hypothetical protein [Clostridia bacterium]
MSITFWRVISYDKQTQQTTQKDFKSEQVAHSYRAALLKSGRNAKVFTIMRGEKPHA